MVEADESDGSFLLYNTAVALVTNVDPDHLDHYGSRDAFEDAFVRFAGHASELVVISSDDAGAVKTTRRLPGARVMTFGTDPAADIRLHSVVSGGTVSFVLNYLGNDYPATLTVPGLHNALNAAGAFGVLVGLGYPPREALAAVAGFEGTQRRFEFKGEVRGVRVYDDFAHHPTELAAALSAARGVVGAGRLLPIFQPHLYSRTRLLAAEFARTFETLGRSHHGGAHLRGAAGSGAGRDGGADHRAFRKPGQRQLPAGLARRRAARRLRGTSRRHRAHHGRRRHLSDRAGCAARARGSRRRSAGLMVRP